MPAKCQALYQAPGQQHLVESSQLYEVGIVIPVSPRREELKETGGPDRLSNCKVPALTLEHVFKGMRNSKQGSPLLLWRQKWRNREKKGQGTAGKGESYSKVQREGRRFL